MLVLNESCDILSGVGPNLSGKLKQCGIQTLQDLLFHLPYRYQDRTRITPIQDLRPNDWCVVMGQIQKMNVSYGKRMTLTCFIEDKTGFLKLRFFHFNKNQIAKLREAPIMRVFGEVRMHSNSLEMVHPEYQLLHDETELSVEETLTPIYSTTNGLKQTKIRQLIQQTLVHTQPILHQLEWISSEKRETLGLPSLADALSTLHYPTPDISLEALENGSHPALKRLAFDELIAKRLSMQFARLKWSQLNAPVYIRESLLAHQLIQSLPFELTSAQNRVYEEIRHDLTLPKPMLRLVQGDVGAGKTIIAALAALQVIASGHQVALMAPTDLLSEQHEHTLKAWLTPFSIRVLRLNGKMKIRERRTVLTELKENTCLLVIGTHALFQETVEFCNLGLIIIDEQHRFGVEQRLMLQKKGNQPLTPHQLMMTATPIPRTLAMTQFAHLDLSVIDELPPGRTPIITTVMSHAKRAQIIQRLHDILIKKRQAYWVCTLIDESEKLQCMAATQSHQVLKNELPHAQIGLIHGRMSAQEKEITMRAFKEGTLDLLVATTVIEVGVDVPNASLMIIENAERLGLSQLHQLRGRVGRGGMQSHCLLLYQGPLSKTASARLHLMRETTDGFLIAEKDLELRGSGHILGTQQTGYRAYKIASLPRDAALLELVASEATELIKKEPATARHLTTRWLGEFESFFQV